MSGNAKRLIIINTIKKIIDIFLGPFLTAYFFKLSADSVVSISTYGIYSYLVVAAISLMVGIIIKNKYEIQMFRFGMISNFFQLIILVILGKNVVNYIWLVGIISGISIITWAFPLNIFSSVIISNEEKKDFVIYKMMFVNIVKVIIPVLFGALISIQNFEKITLIVLCLSFVQILISFRLEFKSGEKSTSQSFNLSDTYKRLKNDVNVRELFMADFFQGMSYEGALDTAVTLLIIISFSNDFSLGVVTSIASILSIFGAYICKRIIGSEKAGIIICFSCIIPLISTVFLLFFTNKFTTVGYNIVYAFFIQTIIVIKNVKTLKLTNSKVINSSNLAEAYVLFELFLGLGRVISYAFLLIVGMFKSFYLLKILIICLTLCIFFVGKHVSKIEV